MPRRTIAGARPEHDPLPTSDDKGVSLTTDTELRWNNRTCRPPIGKMGVLSFLLFAACAWQPVLGLFVVGLSLVLVLAMVFSHGEERVRAARLQHWSEVAVSSLLIEPVDDVARCSCPEGTRYISGLHLQTAGPHLYGRLGVLLRAIRTSIGVTVVVEMDPRSATVLLGPEVAAEPLDEYYSFLTPTRLDAYVQTRGSVWAVSVAILGQGRTASEVIPLFPAVTGVLPDEGWQEYSPAVLSKRLRTLNIVPQPGFHATGEDLSEWLVQLAGELSSEVGGNVPGEFLMPVRLGTVEYRIGYVVNPETLESGPVAGFSHEDLLHGLLVSGGTADDRCRMLTLLVEQLIRNGKRVFVVTTRRESAGIASLVSDGVSLELGRDFVLNPLDPEGMSRKTYVVQLMKALEIVAGSSPKASDLRSAVELELALMRAMSIGGSTLADVRLNETDVSLADSPSEMLPDRASPSYQKSLHGMAAVRTLYEGAGASAFYGSQTAPIERVASNRLVVMVISLEAPYLEKFALDLLSIKLGGMRADPDLVVIFEDAHNLLTSVDSHRNREEWVELLLRRLVRRGPLVVSVEHLNGLPYGARGIFSSSLVFRLQDSGDIRAATDFLGLSVIGSGLYSKQRSSPRETSFLRSMPSDTALLKTRGITTCIPLVLDPAPEIRETLPYEPALTTPPSPSSSTAKSSGDTLLGRVAGDEAPVAIEIMRLLERYEPLTVGAIQRFVSSSLGTSVNVEGVLTRLERANMILRGHEVHGNVSYMNYRLTMKGTMALRQVTTEEGSG